MFSSKGGSVLSPDELAICQRVFDHLCAVKQITLEIHRDDVAKQILLAFRDGARDEKSLIERLL